MSDQTSASPLAPEVGQPQVNVSQPAEQVSEVQPAYVTLEQAQKLANEAAEQAFRRAQGLIDKRNTRYQEKLQSLETHLDSMRKHEIELSPDQVAKLRRAAYDEAMQPDPSEVSKPGNAKPVAETYEPSVEDRIAAVNLKAEGIVEVFGIDVEEGDPEF